MEIKDIRLENLRVILEAERLTQTELAIRCGISPSVISQIMTKRRNMGSSFARKLEGSLELTEGWFDSYHPKTSLMLEEPDYKINRKVQAQRNPAPLELSNRETMLIRLFRQMPETEKSNIIMELSNKKQEYDRLLDELIAIKTEEFSSPDEEIYNENNK